MRVVEFAGTICAGKMSLVEGVRRLLQNYTVKVIAEDLTIQTEMAHPKDHFERQVLLANDVTSQLIRFRDLGMANLIVLVHRGLFDSQAFLTAYVKAGSIPSARASPQIAAWRANAKLLTDLVVLVKTPAEVAFRRAKRKFSSLFELEKPDVVFTREFFGYLEAAYAELEQTLPVGSLVVDGTKPVEKNINKILVEGIDPMLAQAELEQKEEGSTWKTNRKKRPGLRENEAAI